MENLTYMWKDELSFAFGGSLLIESRLESCTFADNRRSGLVSASKTPKPKFQKVQPFRIFQTLQTSIHI